MTTTGVESDAAPANSAEKTPSSSGNSAVAAATPQSTPSAVNPASGESAAPSATLTLNVSQLLIMAGAATGLNGGIFIPLHFDLGLSVSKHFGVSVGAVYRYDNGGTFAGYSEFIFLVGPRFAFSNGLSGGFINLRAGLSYASGPVVGGGDYDALALAVQPEIGYAWDFGTPGFYLSLSGGLLAVIPLSENRNFAWSAIGQLVHRYHPIVNLALGFAL